MSFVFKIHTVTGTFFIFFFAIAAVTIRFETIYGLKVWIKKIFSRGLGRASDEDGSSFRQGWIRQSLAILRPIPWKTQGGSPPTPHSGSMHAFVQRWFHSCIALFKALQSARSRRPSLSGRNLVFIRDILLLLGIEEPGYSTFIGMYLSYVVRKPIFGVFRPGLTQTGLCNHRRWLKA